MGIRYEEYADASGGIPFVLYEGIERSARLYSECQNWHENLEFQLCTAGEGFVLIDGERHAFRAGELALVGANAIHYTFSDTAMTYSCLIVSTAFCEQMGIDYRRLAFSPLVQSETLRAHFAALCREYRETGPLRTARLHYLLLAFLMAVVEGYATPKSEARTEDKEFAAVKRVLVYLRENFQKRLTLDELARAALTDKYTLCRIFKKNTGQTIFQNLCAYRCLMASEYIARGMRVCEAAERCGFENKSFFTKTFKRYMGRLPKECKHHPEK